NLLDKAVVDPVEALAQLAPTVVGQRLIVGIQVRVFATCQYFFGDPEFVVESTQVELPVDHANGAGDGLRIGQDRISRKRDRIAARGRHIRHGNYQRLLLAEELNLPQDFIGSDGI